jgi:hypothetical protein
MLKENIPRLQSLTKQKEFKEYKEYEEFKELLKRHLVLATRNFNERTRLTRGGSPPLLELLELLELLVLLVLLDFSTSRLLDSLMPSIKMNLRNHLALIPDRLRY